MKEHSQEKEIRPKYRHDPTRIRRIFDRFRGWMPGEPPYDGINYAPPLSDYDGPAPHTAELTDLLMKISRDGLESIK